MGTLFTAKMTLKDGYGFGGFSLAPPSKQVETTSEYPPPPPGCISPFGVGPSPATPYIKVLQYILLIALWLQIIYIIYSSP